MTAKEKILRALKALPKDASYKDAMECLLSLAKIEKGIQQADAGKTIPRSNGINATVIRRMKAVRGRRWLTHKEVWGQ